MNTNDMDLLHKEVELMKSEYPKHPDFAKRLAATLRDNARFRTLLENQLVLDERKKSGVVLMQFLHFYDGMRYSSRSQGSRTCCLRETLK